MLVNSYTLPDLVDLALKVPEVGYVNFNILYTVLQTMITQLGLTNARPWCHINDPMNAKAALTQAKLKGEVSRSSIQSISTTDTQVRDRYTDESRKSVGSETIQVSMETKQSQTNMSDEEKGIADRESVEERHSHARQTSQTDLADRENVAESRSHARQTSQTDLADRDNVKERRSHARQTSQADLADRDNVKERRSHARQTSQTDLADRDKVEERHSHARQTSQTDLADRENVAESRSHVRQTSQTDFADRKTVEERTQSQIHRASQTDVRDSKHEEEQSPSHYHSASQTSTEIKERQQDDEGRRVDEDKPGTSKEEEKDEEPVDSKAKKEMKRPRPKPRHKEKSWDDISDELKSISDTENKEKRHIRDAWHSKNLEKRVQATEEGLMRLTEILDWVVNKFQKIEARRKAGKRGEPRKGKSGEQDKGKPDEPGELGGPSPGSSSGPSSAEIESLEDRIIDLEESREVWDHDHDVLVEVEETLRHMEKEFETIKSLGENLDQMKKDILKKADKEETEHALSLKADITLVDTKVDQVEFETAIEELGEAIGLLGIKFQKKNEEWEDRSAELWEAVNSKMTRDIFEAARIKIEERLTALMYGLKTLKQVVEELLYPDSGGVTRCITCRRPADISGHKCINLSMSPKRHYKSSDDSLVDGKEKIMEALDLNKKQKLDGPPYGGGKGTIIKVPYSSSTYNSSTDESDIQNRQKMTLAPIKKTTKKEKKTISSKPEFKSNQRELFFTDLMINADTKSGKNSSGSESSTKLNDTSSKRSGSVLPDIVIGMNSMDKRDLQNFPLLRMMPDPSRRGNLSQLQHPQQNPEMFLSPIRYSSDDGTESTDGTVSS